MDLQHVGWMLVLSAAFTQGVMNTKLVENLLCHVIIPRVVTVFVCLQQCKMVIFIYKSTGNKFRLLK